MMNDQRNEGCGYDERAFDRTNDAGGCMRPRSLDLLQDVARDLLLTSGGTSELMRHDAPTE